MPIPVAIAASAGNAFASVLKSLNPFSSSGPDAKKWEYRRTNINAAISQAQLGNVYAFWALGAYGQRTPNPKNWARNLVPGLQPDDSKEQIFPAGYTSREWGDAYDKLVNSARSAYDALLPKFQATAQGVSAGPGVFQIPTVPNVGNGTFANNDTTSNPAGVIPGSQQLPDGLGSQSGPFNTYPAQATPWVLPAIAGLLLLGYLAHKHLK